VIASPPLEAAQVEVDGIRWTHVFYESGLAINVLAATKTSTAGMFGDKAKLKWPVSIDGKKMQSETYKIIAVLPK